MFLEIRDLSVLEKDNREKLFSIGRVRVHYSIMQLIKGNYKNAVSEIEIIKSKFAVDIDRDRDLIDFLEKLNSGNTPQDNNLPEIVFKGRNLDISITNKNAGIRLTRLFFKLNSGTNGIFFSAKGKASIVSRKSPLGISYFNSGFRITAAMGQTLYDFTSRITLRSLKTNLFSLRALSLQVKRNEESVVIRKIEDSSPLDMEVNYYSVNKDIELKVISENFTPSRYFHSSVDSVFTEWFGNSYTADFRIKYSVDSGNFVYDGNIDSSGSAEILGGKYRLKTSFKGDRKSVYIGIADLESSYGRFIYKGNFNIQERLPGGFLEIRNGRYKKAVVSSRILFSNKGNEVFFNSLNTEINGISLLSFSGNIKKYAYDIDFSSSFSVYDSKGTDNEVNIEGNFQITPDMDLQVRVSAENVPLTPFNPYNDKIKSDGITASLEGFATTDFNDFSFSILNADIGNGKDNSIRFNITGNNDSLSITSLEGTWNGEKTSGKLFIQRRESEYTANGELSLNSYPFRFMAHTSREGFFISGDYDFTLAVFRSDSKTSFIVKSSALPVPVNGNVSELSVNCSGYYLNNANWKVIFNTAEIQNFPLPVPENDITFSGEITQDEILLKSLVFKDPMSVLYGEGRFFYNIPERQINGNLSITDDNNTEYYSAAVNLAGNRLSINADFAGAPVERFKKSSLSGLVTGNINISGDTDNPEVRLSFDLKNGIFRSAPFKFQTALDYSGKRLDVKNLSVKYRTHEIRESSGFIDADTGLFSLSAKYNDRIGGHSVQSGPEFTGRILIPDTGRPYPLSSILKMPFEGVYNSRENYVDGKKAREWSMHISRSRDLTLSFSGGPENSVNGFFDKEGRFKITTSKGIPLRTTATGRYRKGNISISMRNLEVDMNIINIVKISGFSFTGGTAYGNLDIKGSVKDPEFHGKLRVQDAGMALSYLPDRIEPFDTVVTVEGRDVQVKPVDIISGNSTVSSKASFVIDRWITRTFDLQFVTKDGPDLHLFYKIPSVGLGVDGFVKGSMFIRGKGRQVDMGGDIRVDDCIITLSQKTKDQDVSMPAGMTLNMNFTTGKKVEVLWPSANVPILKAYTEPDQRLEVNMDGLAGTYSIKGDIGVKYGEIYYFQRNFYITSGTIIFNESEESFDPIVDFKAQIREVDSKGEVVNVYMYLDKTPLSKFAPRFESDPPLSTVEIMSMLGSNVFAQLGTEKIDISSALMLTGDIVSQFGIIRGFEQKVKDIFNLDLFSIRTQMIQNIILDRFTDIGINDNTSADLFGKYLDNTTIYLGKYFGNTLFLQTMIQVGTYTDFTSDYVSEGTLQVQTKVNLEWKTPLFLLDLAVEPDFLDPVSSINNTSLSFSWGFSY